MKNLLFTALLTPIIFCCAPDSVLTPARAADSSLTGITIPRQGEPFMEQQADFNGLLKAIATDKKIKLVPTGDVEVFIWKGDVYRQDRVKVTQGGVRGALEAAGYTIKDITDNDLFHVNIFDHFDSDDSFQPAVTKPSQYFQAVNVIRGKALVGAWLESESSLALGLLPVQYKAAPKPKPLPQVASGAGLLVKNIHDTGASLPRPVMPKFPTLARKPRMVRGYLKDGGGRPVVGGEVAVHVSAGGGFRTTHTGRSNAQGLYQVLLPAGVAEVVQVDTQVSYNGQKFTLALDPVTGKAKQFNATQGHVEHYVLQLQQGKAGGTIYARDGLDAGIVEITITPQGRLMDG